MECNPPGVTVNDCKICAGFDAVAAQYAGHPTILNKLSQWREDHAEWDACPDPRGGTDG
ncbi:hypothetical protein ACWGKU_02060 [Kitasatospora sp. NPDC054768]